MILNALRGLGADDNANEAAGKRAKGIAKETTAEAGSAAGKSLPRNQVEALWSDHVQLDLCIASLDEDGLIEILPDRSLRLPQ
jgi:A/G-specific adenine glycosylase